MELNRIYNEDCLEGMKDIPDGQVNCIITSPPYNVGLEYDEYQDSKPYDEYLKWIRDIFTKNHTGFLPKMEGCASI